METDRYAAPALMREGTQDLDIPTTFRETLLPLLCSLDYVRVWGERRNHPMTAQELEASARYARDLAEECETWARLTRENETINTGA